MIDTSLPHQIEFRYIGKELCFYETQMLEGKGNDPFIPSPPCADLKRGGEGWLEYLKCKS
jgi:hypothetical protein